MASDPHFRDDFDYPRRRGRLLPLSVAVVALLGFASIVWYAYTWGVGSVAKGGLPTVAAPAGPEKERPSSPGGLEVPHQDSLVLNEGIVGAPEPQVERLLPPPEEPQPPQPLEAKPLEGENVAHQSLAAAPATPEVPAAEAGSAAPAAQESAAAEPAAPAAPAPPQAPAPATAKAQTAESPAKEQPQPAAVPEPPAKTEAAATPPEKPAPPAKETQVAAAQPATKQVAAITKGSHVLQLASVKSEADAERAWEGMKGRFPNLLDGLQLKVERADLGSKGVYFRVVVGPFPNRSTASDLCAQLKAERQDCLVRQF